MEDAKVTQEAKDAKKAQWWAETKMDLKWATALLFVLVLAVSGYLWSSWRVAPSHEEDLAAVTDNIFSQDGLVVPFEVLSILLLAALIAAVVIALREPEGGA
jgi:NADH:ubiquinone oxidoreductase subunit 6 (subunit J)